MNKSVGERELLINGRRFQLRPDFSSLVEIEELTGKTIMQLMASFANAGLLSAKDIIYVLYATAKSGDEKFNYDLKEFGQMILDEGDGPYGYMEIAAEMISFVMTGGKKKEDEDLKEPLVQETMSTGETSITQQ